jgi:very-short-patch-repair endonuclease
MSTARARSLRKHLSPPEAKLWNALRIEALRPYHFRRQVPIGPFYVDFASHLVSLIIEVDGVQHFSDTALADDARRDAFLRQRGYRVMRFTTPDVFDRLNDVIRTIEQYCTSGAPHPPAAPVPLPARGRDD